MLYRIGVNRSGVSVGCGFFIILIGLMLLSPLVDIIVDILGWILIIIGAIILSSGLLNRLFNKPNKL